MRSLPQFRSPEFDYLSCNKVPRGIADLYPCIDFKPGKKRTMLAYLQRQYEQRAF